mmetsp:Transcript_24821/g.45536  ORF Transcript_24821/g.45536 Transcript_24821/m.45536 type:complete len:598 (-) Transcript_24821:84-1877(-)
MKQQQSRSERADGPASAQTSHSLELVQIPEYIAESEERGAPPVHMKQPTPVRFINLEFPSDSKDAPPDSGLDRLCSSGSGEANRSISAVSTNVGRSSCQTEATEAPSRCSRCRSPTPSSASTAEQRLQHTTPTLTRRSSTPLTPISSTCTPSTPARGKGNPAGSPGDCGTSRSETASPAQERKIFVGGVPQDFAQEDLYDVFHEFGPIRKAWLQKCKPGQPGGGSSSAIAHNHRGFGFVVFQDRASIDEKLLGTSDTRMLALPPKFSGGKAIEVKRAKSNNQMQQEATAGKQSPAPTAPIQEEPVTPQRSRRRQQVASSQAKASAQVSKPQLEPGQQSPVQTGSTTFSPSCSRHGGDAADRDPGYPLNNSPVRPAGPADLGLLTLPVSAPYHNAAQQQARSPMPQLQLYNPSGRQFSAGGCAMQVLQAPAVSFSGTNGVASWPTGAVPRMAALPSVQTQPNMAATCAAPGYRPADEERYVQPPASQSPAMWQQQQQQWQGRMHVQAIQPQPMASHQYCFQREVQTPQLPAPLPEREPEMTPEMHAQEDHRSGTPVPDLGGPPQHPLTWGTARGAVPEGWQQASEQMLIEARPTHYED